MPRQSRNALEHLEHLAHAFLPKQGCCELEALTETNSGYITLICRSFAVLEQSPQGKLYRKGKANQPLDGVNIFAVLCSQLA